MRHRLSVLALTTALSITLSASISAAEDPLPPAGDPVTAEIITLVSSIPLAVDRAAYDLAERAFASEIIIDYTSLWGGDPNTMTPAELMTAWQGIVPGFDATWHELGPVTVSRDGNSATATAFVDGRHWIGDDLWRPVGHYVWDVEEIDGEWKVTRMVFDMTEEVGDRSLVADAMDRAGKRSATENN